MYLPRPLVISIVLTSILVLTISLVSNIPANALLEVFIFGLLAAILIAWVYRHKDAKTMNQAGSPEPRTSAHKIGEMVAELDALRRHQRQILLDLPLGVCAVDSEERINTWNLALEKMTSLPSAEVQGLRLTELREPWLSLLHNFVTSSYTHLYKQSYVLKGKKRTVNLHKSLIDRSGDKSQPAGGTLILLGTLQKRKPWKPA